MKKNIIVSICTTVAVLCVYVSLPQSVASSTAITIEDLHTQQNNTLENMKQLMPTVRPFPTFVVFQIHPGQTITPSPTSTPEPTKTPVATNAPTKTTAPVSEAPVVSHSYTDQVIELVNKERAKNGLGALTKNNALTNSAQSYAANMATNNFFSHTGKDGSTFTTRNKAAGYTNYKWMGENIAAGQSTPQGAMNAWMASSGHRANILSAKAKEIGVGYSVNKNATYRTYWVQEFGAR